MYANNSVIIVFFIKTIQQYKVLLKWQTGDASTTVSGTPQTSSSTDV